MERLTSQYSLPSHSGTQAIAQALPSRIVPFKNVRRSHAPHYILRGVTTKASTNSDPLFDQLANEFAKGREQGLDEDDLVAQTLGKSKASNLTDVESEYKDKIKDRLAKRAAQLEEQRRQSSRRFIAGQTAYERGQYSTAVELFEVARDDVGAMTQLGGEVQLWLALAYQAVGREEDCIALYKSIEATHPTGSIRKQAADLRFIMEAPKLVIGEDEKVKIPVLTDIERNTSRGTVNKPRAMGGMGSTRNIPKSLEEQYLENWSPSEWTRNRYVIVAASIIAVALAAYSAYLRTH